MTNLTANQRSALQYIGSVYRFPPKARLTTWKALLDAGFIQGPRFSCYLTPVGRALVEAF